MTASTEQGSRMKLVCVGEVYLVKVKNVKSFSDKVLDKVPAVKDFVV